MSVIAVMKDLDDLRMNADVVPYTGLHQIPESGVRASHLSKPVQIIPGLWLGPLGELREPLMLASEPPGENWRPRHHLHAPYAFWRVDPPEQNRDAWWDIDDVLSDCMLLSRLVRPTTLAFRYACRVQYKADGERVIRPAGVIGHQAVAYLSAGYPDGLQDADIPVLRRLLKSFDRARLPPRVRNALWMHEHLAWTRLMNVRWPLVVTALEALVHTDDRRRARGRALGSTDQFCLRLQKLQDLVRASLWSSADVRAIYELRSSFAHGRGGNVDAMNGEPLRLYELAEDGLRTVLRCAILQDAISDLFRSDATIRTALGF